MITLLFSIRNKARMWSFSIDKPPMQQWFLLFCLHTTQGWFCKANWHSWVCVRSYQNPTKWISQQPINQILQWWSPAKVIHLWSEHYISTEPWAVRIWALEGNDGSKHFRILWIWLCLTAICNTRVYMPFLNSYSQWTNFMLHVFTTTSQNNEIYALKYVIQISKYYLNTVCNQIVGDDQLSE